MRHGYGRLQTATLLTDAVRSGSAQGKLIGTYQGKGQTVPLDLVLPVIRDASLKLRAGTVLLQGFPHVVSAGFPQVHDMAVALEKAVGHVVCCLTLRASRTAMAARMAHSISDDDKDTAAGKALAVHRSEEGPVVQYYESLGKARTVDVVDDDDDGVFDRVIQILKENE